MVKIFQNFHHKRVKKGISFVPQTKNVFAGMTVEENLEMGHF